jgi:DNA-binding MarR family transcriptional regulator
MARKPKPSSRAAKAPANDLAPAKNLAPDSNVAPAWRVPSFLSYRLRQVCLGIMDEVLASADLRPVEYATLTMLAAEPGLDQHQLAGRLAIDKMSMSNLADRLERRSLITRKLDPADRRSRTLYLTADGLRLRRRLQPAALAAQDRILAPLQPADRPIFVELMTRVVEGHRTYARPGNGRRGPRAGKTSSR